MSDFWQQKHEEYASKDWSQLPSMFAEDVAQYVAKDARLLELGAGLGNDANYFAKLGAQVTATDLEIGALTDHAAGSVKVERCDIASRFPYGDGEFDIVYAHLSLHYFDDATTKKIFEEIARVLTSGGIFAFLVNSAADPEYGAGEQIEESFYAVDGKQKRFFTAEDARHYAGEFVPIVCDNKGETYKDSAKGVHNLIRFIGKKT